MRYAVDFELAAGSTLEDVGLCFSVAIVEEMLTAALEHEFFVVINSRDADSIEYIRSKLCHVLPAEKFKVLSSAATDADSLRSCDWYASVERTQRNAYFSDLCVDTVFVFAVASGRICLSNVLLRIDLSRKFEQVLFIAGNCVDSHESFDWSNFPAQLVTVLKETERRLLEDLQVPRERVHFIESPPGSSKDCKEAEALTAATLLFNLALQTQHGQESNAQLAKLSGQTDIYRLCGDVVNSIDLKYRNSENLGRIALALAQTFPEKREKRLYLDVSELVHRDSRTGIQRVVRSISRWLLENQGASLEVQLVYGGQDRLGYRHAARFTSRLIGLGSQNDIDEIIEPQSGDIFLGLDLQHHVVLAQAEYFSQLRRQGVLVYFVVYDILPILLDQCFPSGTKELHENWLSVIAGSDGLLCISRSVADEVISWLSRHASRSGRPLSVGWFHLGADVESSIPSKGLPENASLLLSKLNSVPTFLMVGTLEPRKGHSQVLKAFERLWLKGLEVNLAIVGKLGWNVDSLRSNILAHAELGKRLHWFEGVTDEYLEKIYSVSSCLIAASEGEGFGLPLIEAAQHNKRIICRDLPVFREVAKDGSYYFSGKTAEELEDSILRWLELEKSGSTPESSGIEWLTWAQSASSILSIIVDDKWYAKWTGSELSS